LCETAWFLPILKVENKKGKRVMLNRNPQAAPQAKQPDFADVQNDQPTTGCRGLQGEKKKAGSGCPLPAYPDLIHPQSQSILGTSLRRINYSPSRHLVESYTYTY
jgi:hypothetical protein